MRQTPVTRAVFDILRTFPGDAFWVEDAASASLRFMRDGQPLAAVIRTTPETFPTVGHVRREIHRANRQAAALWAMLVDHADESGTARVDVYGLAVRLWPGCKLVTYGVAGYEAVWSTIEFLSHIRLVDRSRGRESTEWPVLVVLSTLRSRDELPPALVAYRINANEALVAFRSVDGQAEQERRLTVGSRTVKA